MSLSSLLPKEYCFFDFFEEHIQQCVDGARLFLYMLESPQHISTLAGEIKNIEHTGDSITHRTLGMLHKTFITPLDREEIHQLISGLDDILDHTDAVAQRIALYDLSKITPAAVEMARILLNATEQVQIAIKRLRNMKNSEIILTTCITIKYWETEGDTAHRSAMADLFTYSTDPIYVIKWKEIYEFIEEAIDACEDVANIIHGIVLEHA